MIMTLSANKSVASPGFEGGGAKTFERKARTQKFSHAPKMLTAPLIKRVLEVAGQQRSMKKAVLGRIGMRNCCFGSEF